MTKQEYLDYWNKNNPAQYSTIEQIMKCCCDSPNCKGWVCLKKNFRGERKCRADMASDTQKKG